jgi:DNA polymerase I-like protein with 3'-5' exonuclease and polymerase domains
MKTAAVLFYASTVEQGYVHGKDYALMLNVHDEFQLESPPELADIMGNLMVKAIRDAGLALKLRCPLDGEYKVGSNWAETH